MGLDYIHLGQAATTLSGGEAQRVSWRASYRKVAPAHPLHPRRAHHRTALRRRAGSCSSARRLVDLGNTVVVIEHNLDVIKTADWVIDLGPEGGEGGGEVVATGTPEEIAAVQTSYTGRFSPTWSSRR